MDNLKQLYRDGLISRLEAIESAKKELVKNDPEIKESIKRIAHSLRGSGTTYGFPEITKFAGEVEDAEDMDIQPKTEQLIKLLKEVIADENEKKNSILIIDDDPAIYNLLEQKLADPNRRIYIADTGQKAEQILAEKKVDLIILDLILPDIDGRSLLLKIRENLKTSITPVMVVSVKNASQIKTECFALGADDYFEKPFDPDTLASAVSGKIERISTLLNDARIDHLTELPNRTAFNEAFTRITLLSIRQHHPFSVCLIDVDLFKSVNDTFGHNMGDKVLRAFSSILSNVFRKSDVIARWGGDEFLILLPDTAIAGAVIATEKLLQTLRDEEFKTEDNQTFHITFSAGIAEFTSYISVKEAVGVTDKLLYQAKEQGRNRIVSLVAASLSTKAKVMLVEDDNLTASIMRHRLEREGFEVLHFTDGAEAFDKAPDTGISLVLLDIKMPGMNGLELLGNLRKKPAYANLPIAMVTSIGKEHDIIRAFELGADDYIQKPFSPLELIARINRLLKRK